MKSAVGFSPKIWHDSPNHNKKHNEVEKMTGLNTLMTVSLLGGIAFAQAPQPIEPMEEDVTQGALRVDTEDGILNAR